MLMCSSQSLILGDSLRISFQPIEQYVAKSDQMMSRIGYENICSRPIHVYKQLSSGYLNDKFSNINVIVEKEASGKYVNEPTAFYDRNPMLLFADSLRHFDLPKMILHPHDKDTLELNLLRLGVDYVTGNYRIKLSLRVGTVQDTPAYRNDPSGATAPPMDTIEYIASDWLYFKVLKRIFRSR